MIVITGARGFIGCNLVKRLNELNINNLILVDEDKNKLKDENLQGAQFKKFIEREVFLDWLVNNVNEIAFVFHLGARADTTEQDLAVFNKLNLNYSKEIYKICAANEIPIVYASSAATYGNGELGYSDRQNIENLKPLNAYGQSKHDFDLWLSKQTLHTPFWAGLKFFNVYGPHENHKGRMASVVLHAFNQIKQTKQMNLFQSHKEGVADGNQKRDFIYVNDVIDVCIFLFKNRKNSGIYNLGTGKARSFNDLCSAVFKAMQLKENINYIPTPKDIRAAYQYFTEAEMHKLNSIGYSKTFTSLEDGVNDYVKNYLLQ